MSNSKDNKNNNLNSNEMTKKTSLPLIVGTSAMIIASVMTLDPSINLEVAKLNSLNSACYIQNNGDEKNNQLFNDNSNDNDNTNNNDNDTFDNLSHNDDEFNPYIVGDNGELFYDSTAEDDKSYYGEWDRVDDDDDDDFIVW